MGGIAERIEDGGDVIGDRVRELEGVARGIARYWAKGTRAVDADADRIAAQVAAAGTAVRQ